MKAYLQKNIIKLIDKIYFPIFRRYIPLQTFRYGLCGGANMVLDMLIYFFIFHYALWKQDLDLGFVTISPQIAAFLLTFPITFITGLWLAKNISFQNSPLRDTTQTIRYLMVTIGNIGIKYLGIKTLVYLLIYPSIANAIMTVVTVIFSYIMQKYFTFKGSN
ncbi:MAG: GtrA family protein [Bacteroidetes bacterium]|nr:GtrA family protein [Bacteroidota bacterium]